MFLSWQKGGAKNGVCEGAAMRPDALVPPEPAMASTATPACATCKVHVKKNLQKVTAGQMGRSVAAAKTADLERQVTELRDLHHAAEAAFASGVGAKRPRTGDDALQQRLPFFSSCLPTTPGEGSC